MKLSREYKLALSLALLLHGLLFYFAARQVVQDRPVLAKSKHQEKTLVQKDVPESPKEAQPIQAVSLNNTDVMAEVKRLKTVRINKQRAEEKRQRQLAQKAEAARQKRIQEQKRLEKIKRDAARLARERKLKLEAEKKRLAQLEKQKSAEAKALAEVKAKKAALEAQQKAEQEKLAALREKEKQEQLAREAAARQRKVAGEVNKYKALIVSAIGQHWIVPDNADKSSSSQFRIKLAPDGSVLDVTLKRSSGDPILDRSARSAIYKASPLPVPSDPELFNLFRDISLTVRPESARG